MATQDRFRVTETAQNLTTGLTAGSSYIAQNVGSKQIQYCNAPSDPTGTTRGWFICHIREYFTFTVDPADPVWVRSVSGGSSVTIGDA